MKCYFRLSFGFYSVSFILSFIFSCHAAAEETIEYVAEHLLEVPMDTRALAFPTIPSDPTKTEARFQLGYGSFDAGKLNNTTPMLGAQYFFPFAENWGILAGAFYDTYHISGDKGKALGGVLVVAAPNVPDTFDLDMTTIDGSGRYSGISLAVTNSSSSFWSWQIGYARSTLNVKKFQINFDTLNLENNFSGLFNYAARYSVNTLFLGAEITPVKFLRNYTYSPHLIAVINYPRVGFKGRFAGPDFDYIGNTETNGKGTHIPDSYVGVGINFEHQASGLRFDLGATLYTYLLEPYAHKGISSPLFFTVSLPLL